MRGLAPASVVFLATACSVGALDGFSGGAAGGDAGATDAATDGGAAEAGGDSATPLVSGASCAAIKTANPSAADGRYLIAPVGGVTPFEADCDMTLDGGGWMRVTEAMLVEEKKQSVTVVHALDEQGRFLVRVYANKFGCGTDLPDSAYLAVIRDAPRWTQLRARYDFYGHSTCWDILGASTDPFPPNIIPFDKSIDTARDAFKMGGTTGDAFDGDPTRCDEDPANFWDTPVSTGRRSLTAISRRGSPDLPAGLGTTTSCTEVGEGATSPTYWEYRDVFVR